jgi:hypothetical protein
MLSCNDDIIKDFRPQDYSSIAEDVNINFTLLTSAQNEFYLAGREETGKT